MSEGALRDTQGLAQCVRLRVSDNYNHLI